MSIRLDIDIEGLELLADALISMPEQVTAAAERAGQQVIGVLTPAIEAITNVDIGFLVSNTSVFLEGPFNVTYANATPYALFVNRRFQFVERGVGSVEGQVEMIYEAAFDEVAETFNVH